MVLVYGKGWLGNKFADYFNAEISQLDILDSERVYDEVSLLEPDVVINASGKCGVPNIDWCERTPENKRLTMYVNAFGPAVLNRVVSSVAREQRRRIKLVHLSTGCLWAAGENVREECKPEPRSWYAVTKVMGEERLFGDVLILRMRMPIDSVPNPRNLITKVVGYKKVLDVQNSITVVDDMLGAVGKLLEGDRVGVYNMVNEGTVSAADIARAYNELVDPMHTYDVVDSGLLQKDGLVVTERPCLTLCLDKLRAAGVVMPDVRGRLMDCMRGYMKEVGRDV